MLIPLLLAAILSIPSPAGPGGAEPHLAASRDGSLLMSWVENGALKFASYEKGRWSAPRTIVENKDLFVNWADFPSLIESGVTLYAHWLQKSGAGTYSYDVWITSSRDRGKTWRKPRVLHRDGKAAEHGFVSLVPRAGSVAAVWLDGREMSGEDEDHMKGAMTLRYALVDWQLGITEEKVLDARVCECCTTAMTMTPRGPLVAYRDRSEEEIRDIAFIRQTGPESWSKPARLHPDNWKIAGCPVNGPQLASQGNFVAAAWFTAPENKPRVNVAFSNNAGAAFGKPVRIDTGNAVGRVDVLMLADNSALAIWIEGTEKDSGIFARRVYADGKLDAPIRIASTSSARASGFPRAARIGNTAYVAWTDPATKQVKVATVDVK
jgi:hypothetical protein